MDGKDFRGQHSENDRLPRAPLGNMVVWDTTVVSQLFREQLSEKKASTAETSSWQRYVNFQLPCGPRCPTGQEDCREQLSAKISSFFSKIFSKLFKTFTDKYDQWDHMSVRKNTQTKKKDVEYALPRVTLGKVRSN